MSITVTSLSAPINILTSAGAGGSVADGTYYIVVVAYDCSHTIGQNEDNYNRAKSPISSEHVLVLSGGNNTINVSWDAVTGASSYKVYITKTASGDSRWSAKGVGSVVGYNSRGPTTNLLSISLSDETNMYKYGQDWFCYPYNLPAGLDKEAGVESIEITGTAGALTLQDIYDVLSTGQAIWDGTTFQTLACLEVDSDSTGTLDLTRKTFMLFHSSWENNSGGSFTIIYDRTSSIFTGWFGSMALSVGDSVKNSSFKTGLSSGYTIDNPNLLVTSTKRIALEAYTDNGGNFFNGQTIVIQRGSKNNMSIAEDCFSLSFLDAFDTNITNVNVARHLSYEWWRQNNKYLIFIGCEIGTYNKVSTSHHLSICTPAPNDPFRFYDCIFNYVTNNLPNIKWHYRAGVFDPTENLGVYLYNSVALNILDGNGNAITGVKCSIVDTNGDTIEDVTDVNGDCNLGYILTTIVTAEHKQVTSTDSIYTSKNPFTLEIRKSGYKTYKSKFTINEKIDWKIRLAKVLDLNTSKLVSFNNQ